MPDKTLGAYERTTPDSDATMGEVLARLRAQMKRLLDEADAQLRDEAEGGVAAALIEQETEKPDLSVDYHAMWWKAEREREKAEQERDAWHEVARRATRRARRDAQLIPAYARLDLWVALGNDSTEFETIDPDWAELNAAVREAQAEAFRAEQSRPLTPDAITPAMIGRAYDALVVEPGWVIGSRIEALDVLRRLLIAALTEPLKRPEGAEEIEGLITYHYDDMPAETLIALSDALAERYTPIEGGAR